MSTNKKPELENPLDALIPSIAVAVEEWKLANTEEMIKSNVTNRLNKASDEITMRLLGFNNGWDGKWVLDHCNGRSGESAAGDFIRKAQSEAIKGWLSSICMPKLSPVLKAKLEKEMQYEYNEYITRMVRNKIRDIADVHLTELVNSVVSTEKLNAYLQASKLINPQGDVCK